jgi:hypothetical protein
VTPAAPADELARAYEAQRAQALGRTPTATPRGLALFLRVGLAGWMRARAPLGAADRSARSGDDHPPTAPTAPTAELVRVLTEMALGRHRRCGA